MGLLRPPYPQELKEVGEEQPRLEAEHPADTAENRYPHVLPCEHGGQGGAGPELGPEEGLHVPAVNARLLPSADDHSRVRLTPLDGEPHSNYVNASVIPVEPPAGWLRRPLGRGPVCRTRCPALAVHEDCQLLCFVCWSLCWDRRRQGWATRIPTFKGAGVLCVCVCV